MTNLSRRAWLGAAIGTTALSAASSRQPNLLFIVTDGWRGQVLPFSDHNLKTPNLARRITEGVCFNRTYTSYAVCCPSRAAMLTGKYPHAAGVRGNHKLLPLDQPTFSATLKAAGYRTGYIGKWHLDGSTNPGFVPPERRRGFDYWAAYNVAHQHYDSVYFRDSPTPIRAEGFEADHQTGLAIDFLNQERGKPFLLYLSFVPPHAPFTPPEQYRRDPAALQLRNNVPRQVEAAARKDLAGYYGLCEAVDANLGRLLRVLDDRGLAGDTIVVFTSDHGHMMGSQGLDSIDMPFEEATRIPLVIRYPRRIKPRIEEEVLVSNVDYAPTLLSLCGATPPKGAQGINHAPALLGRGRPSRGAIYAEGAMGQDDEWRMIVSGQHKLVTRADMRPTHLYDLHADHYEQTNLVHEAASRRQRDILGESLRQWMIRTAS